MILAITAQSNYTLADLIRTSEATLLFSFVLFIPGYVVAWLLNLFTFRQRLLLTRFAVAVAVSIAICPILTLYLWRIQFSAVAMFYASSFLTFVVLVFREHTQFRDLLKRALAPRNLFWVSATVIWAIGAMLLLVDLQIGHRLYFPTVTYDYALRSAFISAISRTGVPPHNPYFFPGHAYNLRYHYFWLLLCSAVEKISAGTVSPRQAMLGGTVWCGIGLTSVIALYLRFFQEKGKTHIYRRVLIGVGLLGVTGLDIVPVFVGELASHSIMPSIEWWNGDQITAWADSVLWVPHHTTGLITCLIGFLLIWQEQVTTKRQFAIAALVGVMWASAVGLTIYVTLAFTLFLVGWVLVSTWKGCRRRTPLILFSGLPALLLSLPFVFELFARQASISTSHHFPLTLSIRKFSVLDAALGFHPFGWKSNLSNFLALPVNFFLELGFFFLVGVIGCKRIWRQRRNVNPAQFCGLMMLATSILLCTFVRSSLIGSNDLGWRGFLIAQFVLLLWATDLIDGGLLSFRNGFWSPGWEKRLLLISTLAVGFAGTVYEIAKIRFYPLQADSASTLPPSWLSPGRNLGARTYALRQLYEALKRRTPPTDVFQHNPNALPQDNPHSLYADRQVAAETPSCAVVFGGDASSCKSRIDEITALFNNPQAFNPSQIDRACERLSIDVLVVQDTDPVWRDEQSWVWKRTPTLSNRYARAFACGAKQSNGSS